MKIFLILITFFFISVVYGQDRSPVDWQIRGWGSRSISAVALSTQDFNDDLQQEGDWGAGLGLLRSQRFVDHWGWTSGLEYEYTHHHAALFREIPDNLTFGPILDLKGHSLYVPVVAFFELTTPGGKMRLRINAGMEAGANLWQPQEFILFVEAQGTGGTLSEQIQAETPTVSPRFAGRIGMEVSLPRNRFEPGFFVAAGLPVTGFPNVNYRWDYQWRNGMEIFDAQEDGTLNLRIGWIRAGFSFRLPVK